MAFTTGASIQDAATTAAQVLGYQSLRPDQLKVIEAIVRGNDVIGILPTGYVKSACYGCLPIIYDNLLGKNGFSIVIIVSPLLAIMKDQVSSLYT